MRFRLSESISFAFGLLKDAELDRLAIPTSIRGSDRAVAPSVEELSAWLGNLYALDRRVEEAMVLAGGPAGPARDLIRRQANPLQEWGGRPAALEGLKSRWIAYLSSWPAWKRRASQLVERAGTPSASPSIDVYLADYAVVSSHSLDEAAAVIGFGSSASLADLLANPTVRDTLGLGPP